MRKNLLYFVYLVLKSEATSNRLYFAATKKSAKANGIGSNLDLDFIKNISKSNGFGFCFISQIESQIMDLAFTFLNDSEINWIWIYF